MSKTDIGKTKIRHGISLTKKVLIHFWIDESGQSTTEYILILSVVVAIAVKFRGAILSQLDSLLKGISSKLNQFTQES